jgi:hypothetical protein
MFLKEIQETKQKRIKLKQLLILLCRIAFILLIVMAFAGPFSKGFLGSVADMSPATVLIIIDDSFSMNGRSSSGTDFDAAKKAVTELVSILDNSDEIYFVPVTKLNNDVYLQPIKEKNSILDSLSKLKISDARKLLPEILYRAKTILSNAKYPLKEIYIVTDGQSSMFTKSNITGEDIFDENTRVSFVLTSNRTPNNISVDSINVKTKIFAPGRIIKLSAVINNHNNFNVSGRSVIFTSGSYRDEKAADFPAGSKTTVDFILPPDKTGYINGKIELSGNGISEDEIPNDNQRYVVFYVPDELKILIVSPSENSAGYLNLAISSSEMMTTDSLSRKINYYKVSRTTGLSTENLNGFNSVVIVNKDNFSSDEALKLKEYIENGGGVIIYPGKGADINSYNEVLNKNLNLPYLPSRAEGAAVFEKVDFEHPVFEGVFKSKSHDIKLESPSITSSVNPQTGNNSQSLIKLNTGNNFLVQYNIGKGKMLMYSVPPDYSCSNFPEANIFSPLTVRSIAFVSKLPEPKEAVTGEDYYFNPNDFSLVSDSLHIRTLNQNILAFSISKQSNSILNFAGLLNSANVYTISNEGKTVFEFPANTDPLEALAGRLNGNEITEYFNEQYKVKAEVLESSRPLEASVRESRSGKMLWQYFLIGALLFLAVEYWLAKSIISVKKKS